jgi:hypothetical protein
MRLSTARSLVVGVPLLALLAAIGTQPAQPAHPRATARDRVGAADTTCDDLCRRERNLDRLYGRDRERLHGAAPRQERPAATAKPATPSPAPMRVRKTVP